MARRNFYEILNGSPININAEYKRIYTLFYKGTYSESAVASIIEEVFEALPSSLRGRTISLSDFNETYGFTFPEVPFYLDADDLISFFEYVWNLCKGALKHAYPFLGVGSCESIENLLKLISGCAEDLAHMPVQKDNLTIFVPKDASIVSVAEIVKKELVVSVLEYHHHGLKGNLTKKKAILKLLADDIESERKSLSSINKTLENQLFQLMNKFVRHDQSKTPHIATMTSQEIEKCYDDIYQMWLLAKLELDYYADRKDRIAVLIEKLNS